MDLMRNMSLIPVTGISARRLAAWLQLSDLNTVNDLIELGFILPLPGRMIALHPMIQEITLADSHPSVTNCRTLCESIRNTCLEHGTDIPYHKVLFGTTEIIMEQADKDDVPYYLRFIEDAFPLMEQYRYTVGMQKIVKEMSSLIEKESGGSRDRALLLDFRSALEPKPEKALKLEKEAVAQITEINADNAHLAANLHANLGALYHETGHRDLAKEHMEAAISILHKYDLLLMHDVIPQFSNYAVIMSEAGETEKALAALKMLAEKLHEEYTELSGDYAAVCEVIGSICLFAGDISQGTDYYKKAMAVYEQIWAEEPELLENKRQELLQSYQQVGIGLAMKYLTLRRPVE